MAFRGWPVEAIEFFEGLEADNCKAYWQANKDLYERCVKGPMEDLLAELAPELGTPRLFRPYRDVRFSKDKTPYKTNIAALIGEFGYVSLSAEGLGAGAGMVHLAADQLERYRKAVDDEKAGTALEAVVGSLREQGHECGPFEALKTAPRGFPKDHPRIELLRAKGLITWRQWPPGPWLHTAKARTRVVDVIRASKPLHEWLSENVGPTALESRFERR